MRRDSSRSWRSGRSSWFRLGRREPGQIERLLGDLGPMPEARAQTTLHFTWLRSSSEDAAARSVFQPSPHHCSRNSFDSRQLQPAASLRGTRDPCRPGGEHDPRAHRSSRDWNQGQHRTTEESRPHVLACRHCKVSLSPGINGADFAPRAGPLKHLACNEMIVWPTAMSATSNEVRTIALPRISRECDCE